MFGVAVGALVKVIVSVCAGAFTSRKIPGGSSSIRDFGILIANILLPNLTLYNTAVSINLEVFLRCSVLIGFSLFFISLGGFCGYLASKVLFRPRGTGIPQELSHSLRFALDYRVSDEPSTNNHSHSNHSNPNVLHRTPVVSLVVGGALEAQAVEADEVLSFIETPTIEYEEQAFYFYGTILACALHNSITLPLSLLQALSVTLPWIDAAVGTSYVFIYNIVMSAVLWGLGPLLSRHAKEESDKRQKIRELISQHMKLQRSRDVSTQTEVRGVFSPMASPFIPEPRAAIPAHASSSSSSHPPPPPPSSSSSSYLSPSSPPSLSPSSPSSLSPRPGGGTSVAVQCEGRPGHSPASGSAAPPDRPASCAAFAYDWRARGLLRVIAAREHKREERQRREGRHPVMDGVRAAVKFAKALLKTPAFSSVLTGLVIGLTPPLRWLCFEGPLFPLMDLIGFLSRGSIPATLLLLGANLAMPPPTQVAKTGEHVRLREAEQNTEFPLLDDEEDDPNYVSEYNALHEEIDFGQYASFARACPEPGYMGTKMTSSATGSQENSEGQNATVAGGTTGREEENAQKGGVWGVLRILSLDGARKSFIFGMVILRLLIIPAIGFISVMSLRSVMPSLFSKDAHDVMLLVLLAQITAPTAINTTILFNNLQYMVQPWSKMLFYQYLACTISLVPWLTLSLWIVS